MSDDQEPITEMITHRLTIVVDFNTLYDKEHEANVQPGRPAHSLISGAQSGRMLDGNLEIVKAFWGDAEPEREKVCTHPSRSVLHPTNPNFDAWERTCSCPRDWPRRP